ncbi:MAG TPA: DHHA1 domain-containing protein, partial [Thermomicrobiaceae bacterium]|nr:DHHA1 domain-containing protein [Thermomicrobiaceae bacterium]
VSAFADQSRRRPEMYASVSGEPTVFLGYEQVEADATVVGLLGVEAALEAAEAGDRVELLLDRTPFYGESGGQVGDVGTIATDTGVFEVTDTQRPAVGLIVHRGFVREGFVELGQPARAVVDAERRANVRRNHTATHLLHAALRRVLGEHAHQAGSLVAPDRLRFDFTSLEPVGPAALREVQELVNAEVIRDLPVETRITSFREASAEGAMALFGEKYGDTVRVVTVPGFSKELCGGTHVAHTGEIGLFVITEEASVASGVRRIEALTGPASTQHALRLQEFSQRVSRDLHVPLEDVTRQLGQLNGRLRDQEREIERLRVELASARLGDVLTQATTLDGVHVLSTTVEAPDRETLVQMGDRLRDRLGSSVIVLGSVIDERPALVAMVTRDVVERGVDAGKLIREIAPLVGGRGGGRPELAQGAGTDSSRLGEALDEARSAVGRLLHT